MRNITLILICTLLLLPTPQWMGGRTIAAVADGRVGKLAFVSDRDTLPGAKPNWEIYVVNADGTGLRRLTQHPAVDRDPAWSPDGQYIAFVSYRGGKNGIYVVRVDGTGLRFVTRTGATDSLPAWSPDGRHIAFIAGDRWLLGETVIYVMRADGTGRRRLTPPGRFDGAPVWSPDGRWLAFGSDGGPDQGLYVMRPDGTGRRRLSALTAHSIVWSPTGLRIAFVHIRTIYSVNFDGTRQTSHSKGQTDGDPTWSPDGRWLAFESYRSGNNDIYLVDAGGGGLRRLTTHPAFDGSPAWGPSGRLIAFVSGRSGQPEIYVMRPDGSRQVSLSARTFLHTQFYDEAPPGPVWAPR